MTKRFRGRWRNSLLAAGTAGTLLLPAAGMTAQVEASPQVQAELEQMYNFDVALFEYVERLDAANGRLRESIPSGQGLVETVRIVQDICREANSTFDQREHLMLGSV